MQNDIGFDIIAFASNLTTNYGYQLNCDIQFKPDGIYFNIAKDANTVLEQKWIAIDSKQVNFDDCYVPTIASALGVKIMSVSVIILLCDTVTMLSK